jgi:transposase
MAGVFRKSGEDAPVWAAFAADLLLHNGHPKAIQHVAIDMSAAYTKGVSDNLGNARVVYDKFHVIQNVVEACDQVRKAESRADAGKRDRLERTRWMWLKNRANWTEKETQKWESMALEPCMTGMAYRMRLVLQGVTSGRMPRKQGSCSETGVLGCKRCVGKAENCSRRCPELRG